MDTLAFDFFHLTIYPGIHSLMAPEIIIFIFVGAYCPTVCICVPNLFTFLCTNINVLSIFYSSKQCCKLGYALSQYFVGQIKRITIYNIYPTLRKVFQKSSVAKAKIM